MTATFLHKSAVPDDLLKLWIEESYRAVAPKRLAAEPESNLPMR